MIAAAYATIVQILDVVSDPPSAFRRIAEGRCRWLLLALAAGALAAVLQYIEYNAVFAQGAASLTPEQTASLHGRFVALQLVGSLVAPLVVLARIVLAAYLIWVGTMIAGIDITFGRMLAVAASAQIVVVLHGAVNTAIEALAHLPLRHGFELGLNLLVPAGVLSHFLALVNPFTIWYLALFILALRVLTGARWRNAAYALGPYAAVYLLFFTFQQSVIGGRV